MSEETLRETIKRMGGGKSHLKLFVNISMGLQEAIYNSLEEAQMTITELAERAEVSIEDLGFLYAEEGAEGYVFALGNIGNPNIEVLVKVSYALDINLFEVAAGEYKKIKHKLKSKQ